MSCILRVSGRRFDVDAYLERGVLVPTMIYRRGEPRFITQPQGRKNLRSGMNIVVSEKEFSEFDGQLKDARKFLVRYGRAVRALRRRKGVEGAVLDFGVERRPDAVVQVQVFPETIVHLAGQLGLGLELSFYPEPDPPSA